MITCPWCGTNYVAFRPNCQNCGGLLHMPEPGDDLPAPPPAPRAIAGSYVWRLLSTDGWAIAALVFGVLGVIFLPIGAQMALDGVALCLGIPFALVGLACLGSAVGLLPGRYRRARRVVRVLREGSATVGTISDVWQDNSLEINGRHPWVIEYEYQLNGQSYRGKVSTLTRPVQTLEVGRPARILYLPDEPQWSSIYPHP